MKVLITGAGGMVGSAVRDLCERSGDVVFPYTHQELDIVNRDAVLQTVQSKAPDVVINCAAWTDVDGCETNVERAFEVNARGPENLALACRQLKTRFVTISTDYVFDGDKEGFYTEEDEPNPQSVYGRAKLEGERLAALTYPRSIIVRAGYIFGAGGTNFLSTVVRRIKNGEKLKVVADTYGTPTYAKDLARKLRELAQAEVEGVFHVVNSGPGVSFEGFSRKAVALIGNHEIVMESVSDAALNRPARRPQNSRLRCLRMEAMGFSLLRDWESALAEFVREE